MKPKFWQVLSEHTAGIIKTVNETEKYQSPEEHKRMQGKVISQIHSILICQISKYDDLKLRSKVK
jgi:hypothetical protein